MLPVFRVVGTCLRGSLCENIHYCCFLLSYIQILCEKLTCHLNLIHVTCVYSSCMYVELRNKVCAGRYFIGHMANALEKIP